MWWSSFFFSGSPFSDKVKWEAIEVEDFTNDCGISWEKAEVPLIFWKNWLFFSEYFFGEVTLIGWWEFLITNPVDPPRYLSGAGFGIDDLWDVMHHSCVDCNALQIWWICGSRDIYAYHTSIDWIHISTIFFIYVYTHSNICTCT